MSKGYKLNSSVSYILISNSKQLKINSDNSNVTNWTLKLIKKVTKSHWTRNCSTLDDWTLIWSRWTTHTWEPHESTFPPPPARRVAMASDARALPSTTGCGQYIEIWPLIVRNRNILLRPRIVRALESQQHRATACLVLPHDTVCQVQPHVAADYGADRRRDISLFPRLDWFPFFKSFLFKVIFPEKNSIWDFYDLL